MARISTGQTFGETGRVTSPRTIGAAEQMATPGMLAQSTLSQPAIQPQAEPVNLYQQVGAPTVGGPPKIFAPPELPAASQDMANLAKALGSFNPVLQTFGEQYVEKAKLDDARAKLVGQQFAVDLQAKFPGQQLAQLRDQLYVKAQSGDQAAAEAYAKVQALSPLQLAYANRYNNKALLQSDINTAAGRFNQMGDIGGTPRDQIPLGDSRLQAAQVSLFRIPNDPVLYAEMAPQIEAKYAEMNRQQTADHLAWKERNESTANQNTATSLFTAQQVNRGQAIADLSNQATAARQALGIDGYERWKSGAGDRLIAAVMAGSIGSDGKLDLKRFQYLAGEANVIYSSIQAGPNGELLVNSLKDKTGAAAQLDFTQKLMGAYQGFNEKAEYFDKEKGEDVGAGLVAKYRLNDPTLSPAEQEQNSAMAMAEATQLPVDQRPGAVSAVRSASESARFITKVQQDQTERQNIFTYDKDPATEIPRIEGLVRSGYMDPQVGRRLLENYRQLQSADMKPYVNAAREAKKLLMEEEMAAMKRPGSEGGATLTQAERRRLATRSAEIDTSIEGIRRSGLATGISGPELRTKLNQFVDNEFKRTKANPATQTAVKPNYESPETWSNTLGAMGRMGPGNRAANYQLQQQVKSGILFPTNVYLDNLNRFLDKGELSDPMRLMIKRAGYQNKPAQFFLDQWKNVYPGVPFPKEYEGRVQQLNGLKISFNQPADVPSGGGSMGLAMINPNAQLAMRLSQTVRRAAESALNVVAPAAYGREMQMASLGPMNLGSTSLLGVIREMRGANQFRGVGLIRNKRAGDYQSDPRENWFFDFNPQIVPRAVARARRLSEQDLNALAFTALTEAGPTARGKLEVAANLINRSATAGNKPIVDIAKAPGQYEGVFGYTRQQVVSATEGRRIFGSRYDQLRRLLRQGI